jgi:hypothetical protein
MSSRLNEDLKKVSFSSSSPWNTNTHSQKYFDPSIDP